MYNQNPPAQMGQIDLNVDQQMEGMPDPAETN